MSGKTRLILSVMVAILVPALALAEPAPLTFGYTGVLVGSLDQDQEWWQQTVSLDLRFRLCTGAEGGAPGCGDHQVVPSVAVEGGHFAVELDGSVLGLGAGDLEAGRWLEVSWSPVGAATWTVLSPGVGLSAVPFSLFARTAKGLAGAEDCAQGQIPVWNDTAGNWGCGADQNTTYSGSNFALSNKACAAGSKMAGIKVSGEPDCQADADALTDLTCADGKVVKRVLGQWQCGDDAGASYVAGVGIQITAGSPDYTITNKGDTNAADDLTNTTSFTGDVSGTYDNLKIGVGKVATAEIADGTILAEDLHQNGCQDGESLVWRDGLGWECEAVFAKADVDALVQTLRDELCEKTCPTPKTCVEAACVCASGLTCGGGCCPTLYGYTVSCNVQQHCEYANADPAGWKQWDVWIWVPPGSFVMGSQAAESSNADEKPVHLVTIGEGYFIGKVEIPVLAYGVCESEGACTTPSTVDWNGNGWGTNYWKDGPDPLDGANVFHKRDNHPQNGLTWQQAKDFCAWVAPGGRLPSESEWEFAASGPVHRKYPWGDTPEPTCANGTANFNEAGGTAGYGCSTGGTMPVGSKAAGASAVGALDMSGNVWEWCEDWYHSDYTGAPVDGSAWVDPSGSYRVLRGGSFHADAVYVRSAERSASTPAYRHANIGARCLRPLP